MGIYEEILAGKKDYIEEIWSKLDQKLRPVAERNRDKLPHSAVDGVFDDLSEIAPEGWTNGFWPGMMWLMYAGTEAEVYKATAIRGEELLEAATEDFENLHHDVGFMWHISSGVHYRLLGDKAAKSRAMYMAASLASRYNMRTGCIRAFPDQARERMVIFDSMMNIPLLYWASEVTQDPRFSLIAQAHADTCLQNHKRGDGSFYHILEYDIHTGECLGGVHGQGARIDGEAVKGSWSRGQAWAVYGYALSYRYTGRQEYLDAAKQVANYFIACVSQTGYIPAYDFRQAYDCKDIDTSAGAIAASGLIEIAQLVPEYEKPLYLNAALKMVEAMTENYCDFSAETDPIMAGCAISAAALDKPVIF